MGIVNLTNEQHSYLTNKLSTIVDKYRNIDYVSCIFTSIYKDYLKNGIKHIDIYIIPTSENHYDDLKAIVSDVNQEEIYKKTKFLLTVIVENPKDYKNIKIMDLVRVDKLNILRNSEILFDRNKYYENLLEEYKDSIAKCFNIVETNPRIKIKSKSE